MGKREANRKGDQENPDKKGAGNNTAILENVRGRMSCDADYDGDDATGMAWDGVARVKTSFGSSPELVAQNEATRKKTDRHEGAW